MFVSYLFCFLLFRQYLFECNVWVTFAKHVLLQLQLTMLNGRDGDAIDVADGAIADAQSGEDTQADVIFLHIGVLFTEVGESVVVDSI